MDVESTLNQPYIFLATVYGGMVLGLVYDIYRMMRKTFKGTRAALIIFDVMFVLSAGVITIGILYYVNMIELRLYTGIGFILGFAIYMAGLSPLMAWIVRRVKKWLCGKKNDETDCK